MSQITNDHDRAVHALRIAQWHFHKIRASHHYGFHYDLAKLTVYMALDRLWEAQERIFALAD